MIKNVIKFLFAAGGSILAGMVVFGLLSMFVFMRLWWDFPASWQAMRGLDSQPQQITALSAPDDTYHLRTVNGVSYVCKADECTAEEDFETAVRDICEPATQPGITRFFPFLLSCEVRRSLACEKAYMDTGRTIYIVTDSRGQAYVNSGASLLPTDAGVILVGVVGAIFGGCLVLFIVLAAGTFHVLRNRTNCATNSSQKQPI